MSIQANDELGTVKRRDVTEFKESHQARLEVISDNLIVKENKHCPLSILFSNETSESGASNIVEYFNPFSNQSSSLDKDIHFR